MKAHLPFCLSLLLAWFLSIGMGRAQSGRERGHGLPHRIDSLLTARYLGARIDSQYLRRPSTKWTVKVKGNLSGAGLDIEGINGNIPVRTEMTAAYKGTVSLSVSYLGLTVSGALNPGALSGRYKDYEINLNSYGNRFGVDFVWQEAKTFKGWMEIGDGERAMLEKGGVDQQMLYVNAYYVFNHRRFSYPAAFSQSYIQRRSQGSFLLGASLQRQRTYRPSAETDDPLPSFRLNAWEVGIGVGYGYNWVPSRRWLIHLSFLPAFVVYNNHRLWLNGEPGELQSRFPEVILTGRGAWVYTFGRHFLGSTMILNFSNLGNGERLEVKHTKWRVRTFYGIRF